MRTHHTNTIYETNSKPKKGKRERKSEQGISALHHRGKHGTHDHQGQGGSRGHGGGGSRGRGRGILAARGHHPRRHHAGTGRRPCSRSHDLSTDFPRRISNRVHIDVERTIGDGALDLVNCHHAQRTGEVGGHEFALNHEGGGGGGFWGGGIQQHGNHGARDSGGPGVNVGGGDGGDVHDCQFKGEGVGGAGHESVW